MSLTNSPYWFGGGVDGFYPTQINDSLRFDDGSSAYLNRTPASAGNRKTWTFSAWIKLSSFSQGERGTIFQSNYGGPTIYQDSGLRFAHAWDPAGTDYIRETVGLFRDPSAWYHVVWWCDTTQAGTRWKIYVNGTEQTLQTPSGNNGEPAQNTDLNINSTNTHTIGNFIGNYFDGYMAEVNFIDGQALDASSFGEAKDGTWIPKSYSGSYGTNGFHLEFNGNTNDTSGNGNNWTANNISAHDYVPDSPTNNFATLNSTLPDTHFNSSELSEGNLFYNEGEGNDGDGRPTATFGVTSGKWYWEVQVPSQQNSRAIGFTRTDNIGKGNVTLYGSGFTAANSVVGIDLTDDTIDQVDKAGTHTQEASGLTGVSNNDIFAISVDLDGGTFQMYRNGSTYGSSYSLDDLSDWQVYGMTPTASGNTYQAFRFNFGQDSTFAGNTTAGGNADGNGIGDFKYSVPSGFLALCSANLPEPTIIDGSEYFNTLLWTGNGSNPRTLSGLDFAADFIWHKSRSNASMSSHAIQDSVRGFDTNNNLYTNLTGSETAYPNRGVINSVSSTGYTVNENASDYSTADGLNENSQTFVSWNWKAGTSFSNSAGSNGATIASSGSVNTDAGFSIVSYVGNATTNATIGHGLGVAPDFIIHKNRSVVDDWSVWSSALPNTTGYKLYLNSTSAQQATSNYPTLPTSSVFYVGAGVEVNGNTNNMIAYCFANTDTTKVGSYTGNGSSDGPFIYTGFRPAWIMIKNLASGENWQIHDSGRDPYNVVTQRLHANTSGTDVTSTFMDFVSNGVKCRNFSGGFNSSGATFIYLAFASSPFKYSNAR